MLKIESAGEAAFALLTSIAILATIAFTIHSQNIAVSAARSAGYAAAVDSVRAADRHNEVARVLNLYEVPYDMVIWSRDRTDTACVIHMGVMR